MRDVKRSCVGLCVLSCAMGLSGGCSGDDTAKGDEPIAGTFGNAQGAGNSGGNAGANGNGNAGVSGELCPEGLARAERVQPRVILVLDGSCSMSTDYPANGAQSATMCRPNDNGRWSALRRALIDPQSGVVPKLQGAIEFGLAVYGTQPQCPIPGTPIMPALNNLAAIENELPMVQPGMFTPTGPALDYVYENMIDTNVGPDDAAHPSIVILATDGEPNSCGGMGGGGMFGGGGGQTNYQPSIDAVTKGAGLGVKTYVISLADSSGAFHDHLQQLADLGAGAAGAKLYEPGTPEELSADLQLVVGGAVGCDIALNGELAEATACQGVVKLVTPATTTVLGCNDANGWVRSDSRHIRVQGTACQMLMAVPEAAVTADFPCGVFTVD